MRRLLFFCAALLVVSVPLMAQGGFGSSFGGGSFGGPSVLGRSMGARLGASSRQVRLRPYISLRGIHDSGLTAAQTTPDGEVIPGRTLAGYQANAGLYGTKAWRSQQLALGLNVGYQDYSGRNGGMTFVTNGGYTAQLNNRTTFLSSFAVGSTNRAYGYGLGFLNSNLGLDPTSELTPEDDDFYDNRTTYGSSMNTLSYMFSQRTSVSATGGVFMMNRSNGLVSSRGTSASGDIAYRLSRRQTISVSYSFREFNFDQQYGNTFMQMIGVGYGFGIGRNWNVNLRVIGYRMESEGLRRVEIDPEIAAIIGTSTGFEPYYRLNYLPGYFASVERGFRNMSINAAYGNTISPGNGVYLTSRQQRWNVGMTYTGIHKWNFNIRGGYMERNNMLRFSGRAKGYSAGAAAVYRIGGGWQATGGAAYRNVNSQSEGTYSRRGWRFMAGISWSPGEFPMAIF